MCLPCQTAWVVGWGSPYQTSWWGWHGTPEWGTPETKQLPTVSGSNRVETNKSVTRYYKEARHKSLPGKLGTIDENVLNFLPWPRLEWGHICLEQRSDVSRISPSSCMPLCSSIVFPWDRGHPALGWRRQMSRSPIITTEQSGMWNDLVTSVFLLINITQRNNTLYSSPQILLDWPFLKISSRTSSLLQNENYKFSSTWRYSEASCTGTVEWTYRTPVSSVTRSLSLSAS